LGKAKLEVGGNVQGLYDLGPGRFGSEAVFVPRVPGTDSEEDDGYLILFVHDENTGYHFLLNTSSNELYEIRRFLLSV
jgi:carotenoid cleavage dioxygenase